jgi:pantoate--beta-alanine ligase
VVAQIETISALRQHVAALGTSSGAAVVGLVPTMGALHAGHVKLIEAARAECGVVVVSIFVNPLQFDRPEDLARYPRTLQDDLAVCRDHGVDVVFAPSAEEMYPGPAACSVDVGRLADHLCGKYRPGHFRGVATVVLKLLEIVGPQRAYFGEKDAQQLAIVRRMVSDFNVPVSIVEVPTVREADGLALSSRNRHLSGAERASAAALYQGLRESQRAISTGERDVQVIRNAALTRIPLSDTLRVEYLEIVDPLEMQPVDTIAGPVRVVAAIWVGSTRLIDNILCVPPEQEREVAV